MGSKYCPPCLRWGAPCGLSVTGDIVPLNLAGSQVPSGDRVEVAINGLGKLSNLIVADESGSTPVFGPMCSAVVRSTRRAVYHW